MVEALAKTPEFEQKNTETERKFMPIFPEQLSDLRGEARPIEQYYLSHPSEDFSLRFRETICLDGSLAYVATLKDRGQLTVGGLERFEVEIDVSPELYAYYKSDDLPIQRKLRHEPSPQVAVDYYDDGSVLCEAEDPIAWSTFTDLHPVATVDVSGDRQADNEWRAHLAYRRSNQGAEALTPLPELDPQQIARDIGRNVQLGGSAVVRIGGRSGSGKSTIINQINQHLEALAISSEVMSTDDYHRGATWLNRHKGAPWTEWDAPIVYDTATMASDIARLRLGESVPRRRFDFSDAETHVVGSIEPSTVLIIEGIYALSPDLDTTGSLDYTMPTPLATSIGRRLVRDMRERPEFADPHASLRYILEQAEPAYRAQSKSSKNQ